MKTEIDCLISYWLIILQMFNNQLTQVVSIENYISYSIVQHASVLRTIKSISMPLADNKNNYGIYSFNQTFYSTDGQPVVRCVWLVKIERMLFLFYLFDVFF